MTFLGLMFWIVVIAVVVWALRRAPFIDAEFKQLILWVGIVVAVFVVLVAFGVLGAMDFELPRLRR